MNTMQDTKHFKESTVLQTAAFNSEKQSDKTWDIVSALNQNLAHAIDLRGRAKQVYWGFRGGSFYAIHKMFDDFSNELDSVSDLISARIMAMGGVPVWTPASVIKLSKLPSYPAGPTQSQELMDTLVASYAAATKNLPTAMAKVTQRGDYVTAGILAEFAKLLEKQAAYVAAHIPAEWAATPARQVG